MKELLDEVRADLKTLVVQSAVHNTLLREHEARSLALQSQTELLRSEIAPIKQHVALVNTIGKWLSAISVGAAVQWAVRHLI